MMMGMTITIITTTAVRRAMMLRPFPTKATDTTSRQVMTGSRKSRYSIRLTQQRAITRASALDQSRTHDYVRPGRLDHERTGP